MEFVEVHRLGHKGVGAGLENLPFAVGDTADGDDGCFVGLIGFDAAADFHAVDTGDHNIEYEQIGLHAPNLDECGDPVRRR